MMIKLRMRMGRACSFHGEGEKCLQHFSWKTWIGRPRHRWEDNISMNVREIRWEGVDWMHLAQYGVWWHALLNIVMNLRVS